MHLLRLVLAKWRALFRRNVVAEEIRDEMQFHVEMRAEALRARGLSDEEATRAALRRFGNRALMQDRGYDVRGAGLLESVLQDVRFSLRMLQHTKAFTTTTTITLALGIGASAALFSVIDAAIIRPLPYPTAERLVSLSVTDRQGDGRLLEGLAPSYDDLEAWQSFDRVFEFVSQARESGTRAIVDAGKPERLTIGYASADFFEAFGIRPIVGRDFAEEDTRGPTTTVALLGYAFWQQTFGGDRSVLGRAIRVDRDTLTVVGILPAGFYADTSVWRPMLPPSPAMSSMRGSGTPTYGLLQPGIEPGQASKEITDFARRIASEAGRRTEFDVRIESLYDDTVLRYRQTIDILIGAVALILLIACLNVSGLLLARGAARQTEFATRAAIGAGRARLVRQLLTESLLLSLASGVCGAGLAWLLLDVLVAILPLPLPANAIPAINTHVLLFALAASAMAAVFVGLAPALRLSQARLGSRLRPGRSGGPTLSRRGGQMLIAAEVALAIVLLTASGLLVRSFGKALTIDIGFEPRSFITLEVFPVDPRPGAQREYIARLLKAIRTIPGVSAAGAGTIVPLGNGGSYTNAKSANTSVTASIKQMSPGYLEALGLAPIQGRLPTEADASSVAVLSDSGARRLFPKGDAIGNQFSARKMIYTVIGVVPDIRSRYLLRGDPRPDVYLPFGAEDDGPFGRVPIVFVRMTDRTRRLGDNLRWAAETIGPPVIVERIRLGSDWVSDHVAEPRHRTLLIGSLGGLALTLTLVGIFGVTAYAVARRTQEIGVRMAFGARPGQVIRTMVGDAAWPMLLGVAVGLIGAYYTTHLIATFLYDTTPHDMPTFVAVAMFMAATAIAAAWLPARRAARVDPVAALRAE